MNFSTLFQLFSLVAFLSPPTAMAALSQSDAEVVARETIAGVAPLVRRALGPAARVPEVVISWADDYPSASVGDEITVTGGLLRRPDFTADALVLTLCHEIGHTPELVEEVTDHRFTFSGEESRADYFTGLCFTSALRSSPEFARRQSVVIQPRIPAETAARCLLMVSLDEAVICQRHASAAQVFVSFLYEIFRAHYNARGLPAPALDRPWLGEQDFLQCRLRVLLEGMGLGRPAFCQDEISLHTVRSE